MRFSSTIWAALGLAATLLNSSCGKWAKAGHETTTSMPRPEYPTVNNDVFSLNSNKTYISYKGTLVIFSHDATVADTSELITASIESRRRWGESKKFQDDVNFNPTFGDDNATAKNQLKLMKDGLQKFDLEALSKTPISAEAKLANAQTLISRELTSLNLPADQQASFLSSWGQYCEAKIIEFAMHPSLAQNVFRTKPSPAPLCNQYYADAQLMTSADCTSQTGDYFKCIWLDGVAKTRWFTSPAEADNPEIARLKTEKRAALTSLFTDENYAATKGVVGFVDSSYLDNAFKKIVFGKDVLLVNALKQVPDTRCLKAVANVGSQGICNIFSLSTEPVSPKVIIDAMEGVTATPAVLTALNAPADRSYTTHQMIQYVHKRLGLETSESDRIFNELLNGSALPTPSFAKFGAVMANLIPDIRTGLGAEFYGSFSAEDLRSRSLKLSAIEALDTEIKFNNAEYLRYLDLASQGSQRGADAANRPGFSKGFLAYELLLQQVDNILSLELKFEDQKTSAFRACLDLNTRSNTACPQTFQLREIDYLPATINWESDGGKIELALALNNVEAIGVGPKARKEKPDLASFFMDLPKEETEGKTLRFELYRNRILDALDIMTGKAFIEDSAAQHWEAGVSIWENVD